MPSHTFALGWEFRKRHAWPLIALGAYLIVLAALKLLGLGPVETVSLVPPDGRGAVLIAPLSTAFLYYVGVCSFGLSGDLAARQSIYPTRLFALPVRTEALVLAPMLHGTVAVALLVQGATFVARWPWGIETPLLWPALLAAVFLAWTQALTWMPYGLPGLRVVIIVLWLAALDAVVLLAMYFKVSEPMMLAILAPQLPLAYLTARYAVARARRGDVPDWRPGLRRPAAVAGTASRGTGFATAARAQSWFEWRRQGRTLPALVAMVLPFELALFWIARDAPLLLIELLLFVLITPPILAGFSTAMVSRANPHARDSLAISPFIATRPLSSAALVAAKLRMAARSTLATWLMVLVAVSLALVWSGNWSVLSDRASRLAAVVGMPRTLVLVLLVLAGLIASTWKQLVQSLSTSVGGREWIGTASLMAALALIILVGPLAQWVVDHDSARAAVWNSLPLLLAVLVAIKMGAAFWVVLRLARTDLLTDGTFVVAALGWVAAVGALYGVLSWLVDGPLVPQYFLMMLAILLVPLARVSAAPLALDRNRHR